MKYIIPIALVVFFVSCKGTKKTIDNSSNEVTSEIPKDTVATVIPMEVTIMVPDVEEAEEAEEVEEVETVIESEIQEVSSNTVEINTDEVHQNWNMLLQNNVSADGKVNYEGFRKNKTELRNYIASLALFIPSEMASQEEKLTFWMNAYNAMTVDLILRNLPLESIKDINKPWDQRLWKLGDKWYNLDEIEHRILRKMDDPRIHFGINCASFSCPPLLNEAFISTKVDDQLEALAIQFVNDSKRNTITSSTVEVSKIFNWFGKDFKKDGSLIDFLNKYSKTTIDQNARVRYADYDWSLNK